MTDVMPDQSCAHIGAISAVEQPTRRECQERIEIGGPWVHLRTYQVVNSADPYEGIVDTFV